VQPAKVKKAFGMGLTAFAILLIGLALVDSFGNDSVGTRADAAANGVSISRTTTASGNSTDPSATADPIVVSDPSETGDPIVVTDSIVVDDSVVYDSVVTDSVVGAPCQPLRVMPLGDSMTAYPESFRGPLFRALAAAGISVDFVGSVVYPPLGGGDPDGEGHGGYTIGPDATLDADGNKANLYENVGKWIPAARPDVIVLTIGTNDMSGGIDTKKTAPARYAELIKRIQLLAPNAVLVLDDIPPSRWYGRGDPYQVAIDAVPQALGNAKADDSVFYAASNDELEKNGFNKLTDIQSDKTHFTASGGEKFAAALLPTVKNAIAFVERTRQC
jgi:GDSL-like Lipase/Acylhydrolase family